MANTTRKENWEPTAEQLREVLNYHTDDRAARQTLVDLVVDMGYRLKEIESGIEQLLKMSDDLMAINKRIDRLEKMVEAQEWESRHTLLYYVRTRPFLSAIVFMVLFVVGLFVTIPLWMSDVRILWLGHIGVTEARALLYIGPLIVGLILVNAFFLNWRQRKNGNGNGYHK